MTAPSHSESLVGKSGRIPSPQNLLLYWNMCGFPYNETDIKLLKKAESLQKVLIEEEGERAFFVLCAPKKIFDGSSVEKLLGERHIKLSCQNCQNWNWQKEEEKTNNTEEFKHSGNFLWRLQQFGQRTGFHYSRLRRVFSLLKDEQFTYSPFDLLPFLLGLNTKILSIWDHDKSRWIGFLGEEKTKASCLQYMGVDFSDLQDVLEINYLQDALYHNKDLEERGGFATTIFIR